MKRENTEIDYREPENGARLDAAPLVVLNGRDFVGASHERTERERKDLSLRSAVVLGLLATVSFLILPNVLWITLDNLPPAWDQAHHSRMSLEFATLFQSKDLLSAIKSAFTYASYYPPFYYLSAAPFVALFGYSDDMVCFAQIPYCLLCLAAVFSLGLQTGTKRVALLALVFVSLNPLTALVATVLSLAYWARSHPRSPLIYLTGPLLGAAILTKWTALLFTAPPLLYLLWEGRRKRSLVLFSFVSVVLAFCVACPWYWMQRETILSGLKTTFVSGAKEHDPSALLESLVRNYYFYEQVWFIPPLGELVAVGLLLFLFRYREMETKRFLLLAILPQLTFFLVFPNKDPRYGMPVVPIILLASVLGFETLHRERLRDVFALLFIGLSSLFLLEYSFLAENPVDTYTKRFQSERWPYEAVLQSLEELRGSEKTSIAFLPEVERCNLNLFLLRMQQRGLGYTITDVAVESPLSERDLSSFDLLITKSGNLSVPHLKEFKEAFFNEFSARGPAAFGYSLFRSWPLPDGSELFVYRRDSGTKMSDGVRGTAS